MTVQHRPRYAATLAIAVLSFALSACGGTSAPVESVGVAGTYALSAAGDQALPGVVFDGVIHDPTNTDPDFHLRIVATSGSLTLTALGHYEHTVDLAVEIDGEPQPSTRWRDRGEYLVQGDSVHFDSEYIENVRFSGRAATGRIEIVQDIPGEGQLARYTFTRQ